MNELLLDRTVVRLLAFAILVHEGFNVHYRGWVYLRQCLLPTLGLTLSPRLHTAVHCALIAAAVGLLAAPGHTGLTLFFFLALSAVIASYSLRLSNHLALAWFMTAVLCLARVLDDAPHDSSAFLLIGLQGLVVLTYFLTFFHKLNAEYLSPESSWAVHLAERYCDDLGVRRPAVRKTLGTLGIHGTLAAEIGIPLLLLVPATVPIAIVLGVLFHLVLGFMDVMHFSSMMFACLLAFVPTATVLRLTETTASLGWPVWAAVLAISLLVLRVSMPRPGPRWTWAARLLQLLFVAIAVTILAGGLVLLTTPLTFGETLAWGDLERPQRLGLLFVWALFLLNGTAPYWGFKTEFSFAMFSNLRAEPWRHLLFPASWRPFGPPRYLRVERIDGLPSDRELAGDLAAATARKMLGEHERLRYTPYFLDEAIDCIHRASKVETSIRVAYAEGDGPIVEQTTRAASPRPARHGVRITLFPFAMPIDPEAPHSELGSFAASLFHPSTNESSPLTSARAGGDTAEEE